MMFYTADYSKDSADLLKVIESNNRKAHEVRKKIATFQANSSMVVSSFDDASDDAYENKDIEEIDIISEDDDFEDEVSFYLEDYRQLDSGFTTEDLIDTLPLPSNFNYRKLLLRLYLESVKEIKEMSEILSDEEDESQRDEIREFIENEKRKISIISGLINAKDTDNICLPKEVHNNIVLAPTSTGNIKVLDDLEDMTSEYIPSFRELVASIRNGTFKGIKRFNNNNVLSGICEVRGSQTRILFQRLNKNTYALITAFVKKTRLDRGYQDFIKLRVTDYKSISDKLKGMLDNPEFIEENAKNVEAMDAILDGKEKTPTYKKEAQ